MLRVKLLIFVVLNTICAMSLPVGPHWSTELQFPDVEIKKPKELKTQEAKQEYIDKLVRTEADLQEARKNYEQYSQELEKKPRLEKLKQKTTQEHQEVVYWQEELERKQEEVKKEVEKYEKDKKTQQMIKEAREEIQKQLVKAIEQPGISYEVPTYDEFKTIAAKKRGYRELLDRIDKIDTRVEELKDSRDPQKLKELTELTNLRAKLTLLKGTFETDTTFISEAKKIRQEHEKAKPKPVERVEPSPTISSPIEKAYKPAKVPKEEPQEQPSDLNWIQRLNLTRHKITLAIQSFLGLKGAVETAEKIEGIYAEVNRDIDHIKSKFRTAQEMRSLRLDAASNKFNEAVALVEDKKGQLDQDARNKIGQAVSELMKVDAKALDIELREAKKDNWEKQSKVYFDLSKPEDNKLIQKAISTLTGQAEILKKELTISDDQIKNYIDALTFDSLEKKAEVRIKMGETKNAAAYIKERVKKNVLGT